ncbi:MAG: phosphonate metabolism protein/1,5-bisphosphokinase (PRPP-forming) PhnN [Granulosicoccaceae bacterium]
MLTSVVKVLKVCMLSNQKNQSGCLVLVIGASGVGKDSLLKAVQQRFAQNRQIHFLKRVITRPCIPDNEEHDTVTIDNFLLALERGEFAVSWQANGNYYGLPRHAQDKISDGMVVVANGSRGALETIRAAFPKIDVVLIAAQAITVQQRLNSRTRESTEQIAQRLQRNAELDIKSLQSHTIIDNDGTLRDAVDALSNHITALLPK